MNFSYILLSIVLLISIPAIIQSKSEHNESGTEPTIIDFDCRNKLRCNRFIKPTYKQHAVSDETLENSAYDPETKNDPLSHKAIQSSKANHHKSTKLSNRIMKHGNINILHGRNQIGKLLRDPTNKLTIIKFSAPWCNNSETMNKEFHKLSRRFKEHVAFGSVNCESESKCEDDACDFFGIDDFPTIKIFVNYQEKTYYGKKDASSIEKYIKRTFAPLFKTSKYRCYDDFMDDESSDTSEMDNFPRPKIYEFSPRQIRRRGYINTPMFAYKMNPSFDPRILYSIYQPPFIPMQNPPMLPIQNQMPITMSNTNTQQESMPKNMAPQTSYPIYSPSSPYENQYLAPLPETYPSQKFIVNNGQPMTKEPTPSNCMNIPGYRPRSPNHKVFLHKMSGGLSDIDCMALFRPPHLERYRFRNSTILQ